MLEGYGLGLAAIFFGFVGTCCLLGFLAVIREIPKNIFYVLPSIALLMFAAMFLGSLFALLWHDPGTVIFSVVVILGTVFLLANNERKR